VNIYPLKELNVHEKVVIGVTGKKKTHKFSYLGTVGSNSSADFSYDIND